MGDRAEFRLVLREGDQQLDQRGWWARREHELDGARFRVDDRAAGDVRAGVEVVDAGRGDGDGIAGRERAGRAGEEAQSQGPAGGPAVAPDDGQRAFLVGEQGAGGGEELGAAVAAAGIGGFVPWTELDPEGWDRVYEVNVRGPVFATQYLARLAEADGVDASVVTFSSIAARNGHELLTAYGSAKAAVIAATQSLARALAPRVRVNAVLPGLVWTDMWRSAAGWLVEREPAFAGAPAEEVFGALVAQTIPLGRPQTADDVAAAVEYLLDAPDVTGQSLHVDGGAVVP